MLKFEYNGIMSDTKNIIITKIEQNNTILNRDVVTGSKNFFRPRENHFGTMYGQNISFNIHMIKDHCNTYNTTPTLDETGSVVYYKPPRLEAGVLIFDDYIPYLDEEQSLISPEYTDYFTSSDVRNITSWLTSPNYPKLFRLIDNDYYYEQVDFFAVITEVSSEHSDKPYELIFTVTCDSPYGYSPEIKTAVTSSSTLTTSLYISNYSDCHEDYVYPTIKVHPLSHGDLTIKNITDNGELTVRMLKNVDFYIDCKNLKFYDTVGDILSFENLGVSSIDNIYFPRLCSGENHLEFLGNAEIILKYREQRKVGVFG